MVGCDSSGLTESGDKESIEDSSAVDFDESIQLRLVGYENAHESNRERYGGFHECIVRDPFDTQRRIIVSAGEMALESNGEFELFFRGNSRQYIDGQWMLAPDSISLSGKLNTMRGFGLADNEYGRRWFTNVGPPNGAWTTVILEDPGPNIEDRVRQQSILSHPRCSKLLFSDRLPPVLWGNDVGGLEKTYKLQAMQTWGGQQTFPRVQGGRYDRTSTDSIKVTFFPISGVFRSTAWYTHVWSSSGSTRDPYSETEFGEYSFQNSILLLYPNEAGSVFGRVAGDSLVLYGVGLPIQTGIREADLILLQE